MFDLDNISHNCCPWLKGVSWSWPEVISQKSRSQCIQSWNLYLGHNSLLSSYLGMILHLIVVHDAGVGVGGDICPVRTCFQVCKVLQTILATVLQFNILHMIVLPSLLFMICLLIANRYMNVYPQAHTLWFKYNWWKSSDIYIYFLNFGSTCAFCTALQFKHHQWMIRYGNAGMSTTFSSQKK